MIGALLLLATLLPPRELTPDFVPIPAPIASSEVALASDGLDLLTITTDVVPTVGAHFNAVLYANVVRRDGSTSSPTRIPIGTGRAADAVWTGDAYFVVASDYTNVWLHRLDRDGRPLGEQRHLGFTRFSPFGYNARPSIVWNGNRAIVVWRSTTEPGDSRTTIAAIARDGSLLGDVRDLALAPSFEPAELWFAADRIVLAGHDATGVVVKVLTVNGTPTGVTHVIAPGGHQPAISRNGDRYLIVWNPRGDSSLRGRYLDLNGAPDGPPFVIFEEGYSPKLTLAPTGSGFFVIASGSGNLRAARVDAAGRAEEHVLPGPSDAWSHPAALALIDSRLALLHVVSSVPRLELLDPAMLQRLAKPVIVSKTAPPQTAVDVEPHPRGHLVVWKEELQLFSMVVDFRGNPLQPQRALLTVGARDAIQLTRTDDRYVLISGASWLVLDGNGNPAGAPGQLDDPCATAVAGTGSGILLFHSRCTSKSIELTRLDPTGAVLGTSDLVDSDASMRQLGAVRAGDRIVFLWLDGEKDLYYQHLSLDGTPLRAPSLLAFGPTAFVAASHGDRVFVAQKRAADLHAIATSEIDRDGTVSTGLVDSGEDDYTLLDAWWNGTGFAVVWVSLPSGTVHELRPQGEPVMRSLYTLPAVTAFSQNGGFYSFAAVERIAGEAHGNVFRIVTRAAVPSRQRSVR